MTNIGSSDSAQFYASVISDLKSKVSTLSEELIKSSKISQDVMNENEMLRKEIEFIKNEYLATLTHNSEEIKSVILKYQSTIQSLEKEVNNQIEENKHLNKRLLQLENLQEGEGPRKRIDPSIDRGALMEIDKWKKKYSDLHALCIEGGHAQKIERLTREIHEIKNFTTMSRPTDRLENVGANILNRGFEADYRLTESREYEQKITQS